MDMSEKRVHKLQPFSKFKVKIVKNEFRHFAKGPTLLVAFPMVPARFQESTTARHSSFELILQEIIALVLFSVHVRVIK